MIFQNNVGIDRQPIVPLKELQRVKYNLGNGRITKIGSQLTTVEVRK